MRAIVYKNYGPPNVLDIHEVEKPTPEDHQVLLKVKAAAVNPLDWHTMRGTPFLVRLQSGLLTPKDTRLGTDVAGVVVAVGKNVKHFKAGDEVYGGANGAFAEYACASEKNLMAKPKNLSYEQAAAVPIAALTALQALRDKGQVKPGQKVLINGAAGGVGTFAVQIAKAFGAEVTGVCSTRNVELVHSIGADHTIDYTKEDFTQSDQNYDLILDAIGNQPLLRCRRVLTPNGTLVMVGSISKGLLLGPLARSLRGLLISRFIRQRFVMMMASWNKEDLQTIHELLEAGKVVPVIDREYTLTEVPKAIRYLEEGHARGKVIIIM